MDLETFMSELERRRFPRQDVRQVPLKAAVLLNGTSLITEGTPYLIEIGAHPIDLSQTGISLSLDVDAAWESLVMQKELDLLLTTGSDQEELKGRIVRVVDRAHILGLEFACLLKDFARFFIPSHLKN